MQCLKCSLVRTALEQITGSRKYSRILISPRLNIKKNTLFRANRRDTCGNFEMMGNVQTTIRAVYLIIQIENVCLVLFNFVNLAAIDGNSTLNAISALRILTQLPMLWIKPGDGIDRFLSYLHIIVHVTKIVIMHCFLQLCCIKICYEIQSKFWKQARIIICFSMIFCDSSAVIMKPNWSS